MYIVRKRLEISASHHLNLSYTSKCENLHGHNWIVIVWCRSKQLNPDGMVALLDYRDDGVTPFMIFFKDGLEMEKC